MKRLQKSTMNNLLEKRLCYRGKKWKVYIIIPSLQNEQRERNASLSTTKKKELATGRREDGSVDVKNDTNFCANKHSGRGGEAKARALKGGTSSLQLPPGGKKIII